MVSAAFISCESGMPFVAAGGVVDHDRAWPSVADLVGVIEHQGRAELADRGGAVALGAGDFQDGLLVDVVAAEMLVDVAQHGIGFDERRNGAAGRGNGIAGIDRVAEIAGVAEVVASRHCRGVGHGEGRKQRMRVAEIDALVADLGHRGRALGRHDQPRRPSGTNRITLCGGLFCAAAAPAKSVVRLADSKRIARRIKVFPDQ